MQVDLFSYLAIGLVAAIATAATVPVFRMIAVTRGVQVLPNERAVHAEPTPTLGGGGMFVGFLAAMAVAAATGWFPDAFSGTSEPWAILGCGIIAYGVGVLDDLREISAPAKTAGIVLAGSMLYLFGVSIIYFRIPFIDPIVVDPGSGLPAHGAVGDGNGQCGELHRRSRWTGRRNRRDWRSRLLLLCAAASRGGIPDLHHGTAALIIVFGICVGFLPYNVHPAQIFMGDGGAILLGSLMAASTMAVGGRTPDPFSGQTFFFYAPLVIPLVILGVPIVDTIFAIIRRATRRQSLATADKDHMHHRLMRLGHGHARSVFILWAWTALLSGFVLWPVYNEGSGDAIVPVGVAALGLILFTLFAPGSQRQRVT